MKISAASSPSAVLLGSNGAIIVADTAVYDGPFFAIKAITDCVIAAATFEDVEGSLDGATVSGGDTIMLYKFLTVQLTSGTAILYRTDEA